MASPLNPRVAGLKRSSGGGIHRPFKSPLRSSGADNASPRKSIDATNSLHPQKGVVDRQNTVCSAKDDLENPGIDTSLAVNENSHSSVNTTPKRPVACSNLRGRLACNINSRPCGTPFQNATIKGQFNTPLRSPANKGQFSTPFRSPVTTPEVPQKTLSEEEELSHLLKQEEELDEEIASLRNLGLKVEELQVHIKNLHEYNEVKDSAQIVLGKLAELEGVTVRAMHDKYGVTILE